MILSTVSTQQDQVWQRYDWAQLSLRSKNHAQEGKTTAEKQGEFWVSMVLVAKTGTFLPWNLLGRGLGQGVSRI